MARPIKQGLDYFPLDTVLDDKFKLIEAEFGLTGFAVVVKLFQKIYGGFGYYCELQSEVALLFGRELGLGGNVVSEIVSASVKRGIFDRDLYLKYHILTSAGIQKRYFEAVSRRANVTVKKEYLLVECSSKNINVGTNPVNVCNNPVNADRNPTKESKVNKSKKENIKEKNNNHFKAPTVEEIKGYCSERNNGVDASRFYDYYQSKGWMVGKNKMKDWKAAVRTWERNGFDKKEEPVCVSYNKDEYIKSLDDDYL